MHRRSALPTTLVLGALLASTLSAPVQASSFGERARRAESAKAIQRIAIDVRTPFTDQYGAYGAKGAAVLKGNANVNGRNITFSGTINDLCPGDGYYAVATIGFFYRDSEGRRQTNDLVNANTGASSSCTSAPLTISGAETSPGKILRVWVDVSERRNTHPALGDSKYVEYRVS